MKAITTNAGNDTDKQVLTNFWWKCESLRTFRLSNLATLLNFLKNISTFLGEVILVLEIYRADIKASAGKVLCKNYL